MIDPVKMKPVQITCAWQECQDENSGYPYYWNMTTNEVTWEMPAEYQLALQKWQLLQQQQLNSKKGETSLNNTSASISEKVEACKNKLSNNHKESATAKKKYPFESDSEEDEKIELITSYGSDSSESSDSESSPQSKSRKKSPTRNSVKKKSDMPQTAKSLSKQDAQIKNPSTYGPSFPPGTSVNSSPPSKSTLKSASKKGIPLVPYGEPDTAINSESKSTSDTPAIDLNSIDDGKGAVNESMVAENGSDAEDGNEEDSDEDFDEDESLILSKLRSQAMILKQLGGEIPDEIKCLIDSENPDIGIDDIIALIENETPPDHAANSDCDKVSSKRPLLGENGSETIGEDVKSPKPTSDESKSEFAKANQPSSFALIAGYGDDSDQEDSSSPPKSKFKRNSEEGTGTNALKRKSLFPIDGKQKKSSAPSKLEISSKPAFKKIKLSARAKALINASIITAKARATPSIPLSEENISDIKPDITACTVPVKEEKSPESLPVKDQATPSQPPLSSNVVKEEMEPAPNEKEEVAEEKINIELKKQNIAALSIVPINGLSGTQTAPEVKPTTSSLAAGLKAKPDLSTVAPRSSCYTAVWDTATTYAVDEKRGFGFSDNTKPTSPTSFSFYRSKSEKKNTAIQFIKAETINVEPPAPVPVVVPEIMKDDGTNKIEIESLSEVIVEKVKFLSEGKEPVSPVQIMAIQVETLMIAWQAGCLTGKYLLDWLNETSKQLSSLEREAAPDGWKCEWDRSFNRYYYRNLETGRIQWDYPIASENEETIEEVEMELCETPPHPSSPSPTPPATPPPPPEQAPPPKTPPPPVISFNPPPPPVISGFKSCAKQTVPKKKSKSENLTIELPPLPETPPLPTNPPPPPPPADTPPPPLPPLPPSSPDHNSVPLPPSSTVSGNRTQRILKEFNQKNAQYFAAQQLPPPPPSYPPPLPQQCISQSAKTVPAVTQQPMFPSAVGSAPRSLSNNIPGKLAHQVIGTPAYSVQPAQPPLPPTVTDLNSALDSFYSDIASLEASVPEETSKSEPTASLPGQTGATPTETESPSLPKKKKKVKLSAGLTLKKKGLDSLVAKWEKVHKSVCD